MPRVVWGSKLGITCFPFQKQKSLCLFLWIEGWSELTLLLVGKITWLLSQFSSCWLSPSCSSPWNCEQGLSPITVYLAFKIFARDCKIHFAAPRSLWWFPFCIHACNVFEDLHMLLISGNFFRYDRDKFEVDISDFSCSGAMLSCCPKETAASFLWVKKQANKNLFWEAAAALVFISL